MDFSSTRITLDMAILLGSLSVTWFVGYLTSGVIESFCCKQFLFLGDSSKLRHLRIEKHLN